MSVSDQIITDASGFQYHPLDVERHGCDGCGQATATVVVDDYSDDCGVSYRPVEGASRVREGRNVATYCAACTA